MPVFTRWLYIIVTFLLSALGNASLASTPFSQATVVVYSRTAAELFWERPDNGVTTEIIRNGERLAQTPGTSYFDGDRERGVAYVYDLEARDATGKIVARGRLNVDGELEDPDDSEPPPGADELTDVELLIYSNTAAELFWTKAADGVSTQVIRQGVDLGSTPGNSFFDNSRSRGVTYTYTLLVTDAAGNTIARGEISDSDKPPVLPPKSDELFPPLASDIESDRSVYTEEGYDPVSVIRVDLRTATTPGSCTVEDDSGCTLDDVLADTDKNDELTVDIPVHFMSDDFADDGSISNAELRLRGGGSRFAEQKSFRIKLDSKKELWRDERFLQLNKHPFESTRMRNKLAMDLMSRVPHLPSFRTQFVNLWIDDGDGPVDYGLYTHVERPNDDYLDSRGLDKDGNLYKASDFRFNTDDLEDVAVDEDGKPIDKDRFESSLNIEEGKDHRALNAMLAALNDPDRDFESVLLEHFNRNNAMAWIATNLLLRQNDVVRHNYILYNPSGTERFYFLPWDYDAAMSKWALPDNESTDNRDLRTRLQYGYAIGAENVFMDKFYRLPGIHAEIVRVVDYLKQFIIDNTTITNLSQANAALIEPLQTRLPDSEFNPSYLAQSQFERNIDVNAKAIANHFSVPIAPVFNIPRERNGRWQFSWSPSVDVTGNAVRYDFQLSHSKTFSPEDIVSDAINIRRNRASVIAQELNEDVYYARVIARSRHDPAVYWTASNDRVVIDGKIQYGMIELDLR